MPSLAGLTSSGWARPVERVLSRVPAVADVTVDFEPGRANIPGGACLQDPVAAMQAAGHGAQMPARDTAEE